MSKRYRNEATAAAFLLGGIGTGNFSIGAAGDYRDFEIFNRPGKGNSMPYTFPIIRVKEKNREPVAKVIEAQKNPPFTNSHGIDATGVGGLPRLKSSVMEGKQPFVKIDFFDDSLPVKISLTAFTPFIPLNEDESGIPGAILRYEVKNISKDNVSVTVCISADNRAGRGLKQKDWEDISGEAEYINEFYDDDISRGIFYTVKNVSTEAVNFGSMAIMTRDNEVTHKTNWLNEGFYDGLEDFYYDLLEDGKLEPGSFYEDKVENPPWKNEFVGSLGILKTLKPGEKKEFEFVFSWYFPNRYKSWDTEPKNFSHGEKRGVIKNYYASLFKDARDAGEYLLKNMERLENLSKLFSDALYESTLPYYVIDAAANNINALKSCTCYRIEDGTFLGFEGCSDDRGCCFGSCTHVWNYAQTLAFLFPVLERTMRKVEFNIETNEKGNMAFRSLGVFGMDRWKYYPAADGQLGTIIRLYRDIMLTGDISLLNEVWNKASKALDFAFEYWDTDGDYILDNQQHNTYDIEFYGPNSLTNSIFYAALKAGEKLAGLIGDKEREKKYRTAFEKGSEAMDLLLYNGEYYIQKLDDVNMHRHQYGVGCLSDQVLGQTFAHVAGLGYILPRKHVKNAVYSVYKYNFRKDLSEHINVQRTYALNTEKGLILCSWPNGGRPHLAFPYSDEVWTGIEYQVATHLIYEGYIDEGLEIVKAVQDRYDGYKRNPWDEVECGHHYVRPMSSWGLIVALSGFEYNLINDELGFSPKINEQEFKTFFSCGKCWGVYEQFMEDNKIKKRIKILYGNGEGIKIK